MYKRIAIALDGSEAAESALTDVRVLANRLKAAVLLIRVIHSTSQLAEQSPPADPAAGVITPDAVAAVNNLAEETEAMDYLSSKCDELRAEAIDVSADLREGPVPDEVLAAVEEHACDLLVITTYGAGGAHTRREANVFGGVADQVLRKSRVPILVVRPRSA